MVSVYQVLNVLTGRPGGALKEPLAQCGKGGLVHHHNLPDIPLPGNEVAGQAKCLIPDVAFYDFEQILDLSLASDPRADVGPLTAAELLMYFQRHARMV